MNSLDLKKLLVESLLFYFICISIYVNQELIKYSLNLTLLKFSQVR